MPCVIICTTPDGKILVNAAGDEAAQQYLQDAVPAASLDEALAMAKDVLGEGETPGQEAQEPAGEHGREEGGGDSGAYPQQAPSGAEGMPMATPEDQMAAGFKRAKKGY